jgi:hypothetical protein
MPRPATTAVVPPAPPVGFLPVHGAGQEMRMETMPVTPLQRYSITMPPPVPIAQSLPMPHCAVCPPAPMMVPPPMMPVGYRPVVRSTSPKWTVQATKDDGEACLQIFQGDDCKVTCEHCVLTIGDESFKVAVHDNQVQIDGSCLKAAADRITRSHHKDQVVLEGHVTLDYHKDGQKAAMSGGTIVVDLAEGTVKMKPAEVDEGQIFNFIMGFFN